MIERRYIVFVAGTRPDVIKITPVVEELQSLGAEPLVILTGQHVELLEGTPLARARNVRSLGLKSDGNITRWLAKAAQALDDALQTAKPTLVVVQGDTMSTYAGAKAAQRCGAPLAHIEAGVRSHYDFEPWPEEQLRREITQMAQWHYAPTSRALGNLLQDGVAEGNIIVTGNTSVSALARYTGARPQAATGRLIVVTLHRRELTKDVARCRAVIDAIMVAARAHPDLTVLWPVHPTMAGAVFSDKPANLLFATPMHYKAFAETVAGALGVLTDSGGLVEEAATLGVPCAVLRRVTDRPEAEDAGIARRFEPTPEGVSAAFGWLAVSQPRIATNVYGTPDAAARIAKHLWTL